VVRLKGGDPSIFGRAAEELEACAAANIPATIVPGITAAQGAAAALNVPLTGRGQTRRLQYVTGHARDGRLPDDLDWQSLADPSSTTAVYMPTRTLAALAERALAAGLDPATPTIAISRATRPDQRILRATIGTIAQELARTALPGPVLVMIGSVFAENTSLIPWRAEGASPESIRRSRTVAARTTSTLLRSMDSGPPLRGVRNDRTS
jgi:uroporphyrin-III C-methyltransferase/precorrin-2 dehydrogenase/sirohydrochlorin ferrochelatase